MYVNVHCDTFFSVLVLAGRKSDMLRSWEQSLQIEEINLYTCSLSTYELNQEHYTDFKKRPICKSANKNCLFLQWNSLKFFKNASAECHAGFSLFCYWLKKDNIFTFGPN